MQPQEPSAATLPKVHADVVPDVITRELFEKRNRPDGLLDRWHSVAAVPKAPVAKSRFQFRFEWNNRRSEASGQGELRLDYIRQGSGTSWTREKRGTLFYADGIFHHL